MIIALGGNLGDRQKYLEDAAVEISNRVGIIKRRSSWYETEALCHPLSAFTKQPSYLNGALLVETSLTPEEALTELLEIEKNLGRRRGVSSPKWAPRTVDLDLIAAESLVISTNSLTLPHAEMHKRFFVLQPLVEILPDWKHPILGKSAQDLLYTLVQEENLAAGAEDCPAKQLSQP